MTPRPLDRFLDGAHPAGRGRTAEESAVRWLVERRGYRVVERNARTPAGEIDLVARDGDVLCFVEVKARATAEYGPAVAAVGRGKQRRIARAAALWLASHPVDAACRFDVLGLDADPETGGWRYTLVRGAFEAG